jgi:cytochrome c oxidase subunit 1
LEWTTSSPPLIENWEVLPVVTHGPYDYGMNSQNAGVNNDQTIPVT